MNYEEVENLYSHKDQLPQRLAEKVKQFHRYHQEYLSGHGDVINQLQWLDEISDEIGAIYRKLKNNGLIKT